MFNNQRLFPSKHSATVALLVPNSTTNTMSYLSCIDLILLRENYYFWWNYGKTAVEIWTDSPAEASKKFVTDI